MDSFEELVSRVKRITGLTGRAASAVAVAVSDDALEDAIVSAADIVRTARGLGYEVEQPDGEKIAGDALTEGLRALQLEPDPAEVLAEVYRTMPRVLNQEFPRVGRAPKESVFYDEELQAQIDALPEEVRVLIGGIDVFEGTVTFRLYDEANDLDREIGPIDLTRFTDGDQIRKAINVLLTRLPRVLSSDFN